MWKRTTLALLTLLLLASPGAAGNDTQWLHVSVDGTDDDPERVRINVPFGLVEAVLPLLDDGDFRHGHIDIDGAELDREEIVELLRAVRDAEEGEYVTVEDRHETVRIAKSGDFITVNVEDTWGRHPENVQMQVPVAVLEALVSGDEDELDLMAAIQALGEHAEGQNLITVDDEDGTRVRIWVDRENTSE